MHTPGLLEEVDVSSGTRLVRLRIADSLLSSLHPRALGGYELAHLEGRVTGVAGGGVQKPEGADGGADGEAGTVSSTEAGAAVGAEAGAAVEGDGVVPALTSTEAARASRKRIVGMLEVP